MRGRTNAGNGIFLNATTDNFVVSENSVVAGDFVEYKYDTTTKELVTPYANFKTILKVNDEKYIANKSDGTLMLINVNNITNEIIIEKTFSILVDAIGVIETNKIIVCQKYSTSGVQNLTFDIYNLNGNNLELLGSKSIDTTIYSGTSTFRLNPFWKLSGSNILFGIHLSSIYNFYTINYSNINDIKITEQKGIDGKTLSVIVGGSENKIALFSTYKYSNENYFRRSIYEFDESTNSFSEIKYSETKEGFVANSPIVNLYNSSDGMSFVSIGMSSGTATSISIYGIDFEANTITQVIANTLGVSKVIPICSAYECPNSPYFIAVANESPYTLYLFEYSSSSKSIKIKDTLDTLSIKNNNSCKIINTNNLNIGIFNDGTSSLYFRINNDGEHIMIGTPTNQVTPWQGTGNPLGVAKQSGNQGQEIEVYIPSV